MVCFLFSRPHILNFFASIFSAISLVDKLVLEVKMKIHNKQRINITGIRHTVYHNIYFQNDIKFSPHKWSSRLLEWPFKKMIDEKTNQAQFSKRRKALNLENWQSK